MKTKKEKKRLFFISFIIIILIVFLGVSTYKDFVTIVNNKRETNTQYEKLLDEKKSLTSEVTKMNDPEYLARYAKEKFLYSKDDEVIIRMGE